MPLLPLLPPTVWSFSLPRITNRKAPPLPREKGCKLQVPAGSGLQGRTYAASTKPRSRAPPRVKSDKHTTHSRTCARPDAATNYKSQQVAGCWVGPRVGVFLRKWSRAGVVAIFSGRAELQTVGAGCDGCCRGPIGTQCASLALTALPGLTPCTGGRRVSPDPAAARSL